MQSGTASAVPLCLSKNLCLDESARVLAGELEGAAARLAWDQMPLGSNALNALLGKAFSERSENFSAAQRWESNGIFQAVGKVLGLF